jgi:Putative prokaryotic signal transducing protein
MFCPRCRQEYQAGVTECRECRVALVAELPAVEPDEATWIDLVTVLSTGDQSQIRVALSLLEAEGIPCFANGEMIQGVIGYGLVGPVDLQVRAEDEEAARALLSARDLPVTEPDE